MGENRWRIHLEQEKKKGYSASESGERKEGKSDIGRFLMGKQGGDQPRILRSFCQ